MSGYFVVVLQSRMAMTAKTDVKHTGLGGGMVNGYGRGGSGGAKYEAAESTGIVLVQLSQYIGR